MSTASKLAKSYIYNKPFIGIPNKSNFKLKEENVVGIQNGEYLAKAVYIKVGPSKPGESTNLGDLCAGTQIAKIVESQNAQFPVGKYVVGDFGWRTLTLVKESHKSQIKPYLLPDMKDLPVSLGLGILGIPGVVGYFGFLEICKPKENDVVVISSAAGTIGSYVGQIAKIKKCRVIGITGSDEKGEWLTKELQFDHYINYKKASVDKKLKEYAPDGIDCYFDNVGGEISSDVIYNMKTFGRICICGATALYNQEKMPLACEVQTPIKIKHAKMEGVLAYRWLDRYLEAINQNLKWVQEGKLKYIENVTEGFENTIDTFVDVLQGKHAGISIVKIP